MKQVGGVRKGGYYRHTTIGVEQRLIGLEGKVRKAWGFQIEVVSHFASPALRKAWSEMTGVAARRITDGSMAFICELPVSNESRHFRSQAKGWQLCAG
ncbi:hypothetical protein EMIT0P260_20440 [Pseudomonas sp. IT-P260]